jgi:hypothetical protein
MQPLQPRRRRTQTSWEARISRKPLIKPRVNDGVVSIQVSTLQAQLSAVAASAQQGVASVLGSIQQTLAPKVEEKQDPEVKDFRAAAAEAAQEAKAYMEPGKPKDAEK